MASCTTLYPHPTVLRVLYRRYTRTRSAVMPLKEHPNTAMFPVSLSYPTRQVLHPPSDMKTSTRQFRNSCETFPSVLDISESSVGRLIPKIVPVRYGTQHRTAGHGVRKILDRLNASRSEPTTPPSEGSEAITEHRGGRLANCNS